MPRKLRDAVVAITGASSGIGRATALACARQGASLVLAARREQPLHALAAECQQLGGRAIVVPTDVTNEEAVRHLARRAVETFGRIDVWVNNAAVSLFGRFEETPLDAYRRVVDTNLFGYVHGARAALPYFREQGSGVLINNASVVATVGQPFTSAYVATKWAIRGLSECLRQELALDAAKDIHVCTILPASIDTPLFQHAANFTGRAVKPMNPVYDAEEVARAIVHLAEHPRREVMVGNAGRILAFVHTIAPTIAERMLAHRVEKEHFQDRLVPRSAGNLFEPMSEWTGVGGGWTADAGMAPRRPAFTTGLMAIVPVLAAWLWFRPLVLALLRAGVLFGWLAFQPFRTAFERLQPTLGRRRTGIWSVVPVGRP